MVIDAVGGAGESLNGHVAGEFFTGNSRKAILRTVYSAHIGQITSPGGLSTRLFNADPRDLSDGIRQLGRWLAVTVVQVSRAFRPGPPRAIPRRPSHP